MPYLHDARDTMAYLMVGQLGDGAVVRSPRRGDKLGFHMSQLVRSDVFSSAAISQVGVLGNSIGDVTVRKLAATVSSQRLSVREIAASVISPQRTVQAASLSGAVELRLDLTPSLGWLMTQPVIGDDQTSRTIGTIAWLFLRVAPACFWSWQCGPYSATATVVVLGAICSVNFVIAPIVFAVAPLPLWQWGTLLTAAMFGVFCSRLNNADHS